MTPLQYAGETDMGRVRVQNQDRWFADPEQGLFLVADGVGGMVHGELAASVVAEVFPPLLRQRCNFCRAALDDRAAQQIKATLAEISNRLYAETKRHAAMLGMGSTVVLALVRDNLAIIAHLGDSRAYLLHAGRLRQLTRDHTLAESLVAAGVVSAEEAVDHPAGSRLTRYVGMPGNPSPETQFIDLTPGDRLLLCCDGLYNMVPHMDLERILSEERGLADVCRELIAAANKAGGEDNVTAVVVQR